MVAFALLAAGAFPAGASAHAERPGYWPDPAADTSVTPAAGGKVPAARSLGSALPRARAAQRRPARRRTPLFTAGFKRGKSYRPRAGAGRVRVVCLPGSLRQAKNDITRARLTGYRNRPSEPLKKLTKAQAARWIEWNELFFEQCGYREIQPAVRASGNNGRVIVMPGMYTEPTARSAPAKDPRCKDLYRTGDRPGENEALSYEYQATCPNDQNLIAVIGRKVGATDDPTPPRFDRHGIPDIGACIRCNLQLEGTGVSADSVIIEAGDASRGNGGPNGVGAKKDVGVRADRADGFVLRRMTVRHAGEHGIYVLESDGYLLDRFKAYFSKLYGTLTFVEDHGLQQNCEAVGHGDSGLYPGAALESGEQRPAGTAFRYNQEIRNCDMHHNLAGYSGTNGNAVHVNNNNIYDNALGVQTDVVTGAGHPGYPGDSALFEKNNIYSNNFNPYAENSDVTPSFPFPVGTGLWIAGGNRMVVRGNNFFDNWRRGTMLFSVPDSLICGPQTENSQAGCDPVGISTSHYNQQHDNRMGFRPDGKADANGIDYWWDGFAGSRGNCWFRNTSPNLRTSPPILPNCADGSNPDSSIGPGGPNELELIRCFASFETRTYDQGGACPWFTPVSEPPDDGGARNPVTDPILGRTAFPGRCDGKAVIASCERSGDGAVREAQSVPAGTSLTQLSCTDWNRADAGTRAAIIERVKGFAGGVVVGSDTVLGTGAVLADAEAQRLFGGWCGQRYARGFLLLKLYTHAAAFQQRL